MKIGIDVRSTLKEKKKTGIGYYTLNLINNLALVDPENQYFLYSYIKPFDLKRRPPALPGPNFHHRLDRRSFRPGATMKDMDVFHSSSYDIPKIGSAKLVNTIHDIIPLVHPGDFTEEFLKKLENNIKRILDESDLVVASSNNTKKDLESRFSPISKRIEIVYSGRDESLAPLPEKDKVADLLRKKYGIDGKFILFVGSIEKRKNLTNLLSAFGRLKQEKKIPHSLVVVGLKGRGSEKVFDMVEDLGLEREVMFTDYVPREDMILFYNAADLFVYPSLYEGFGLPILEAFSCGTPTITSSGSSCGEIAGDAALTIDPKDVDALKSAIDRLLGDKGLMRDLSAKGLDRARLFSWKDSAKKFKKIFQEVI
jgi:glycosyltransferase involved in cell wall biosynthesis